MPQRDRLTEVMWRRQAVVDARLARSVTAVSFNPSWLESVDGDVLHGVDSRGCRATLARAQRWFALVPHPSVCKPRLRWTRKQNREIPYVLRCAL
jgi:hypothetical protein